MDRYQVFSNSTREAKSRRAIAYCPSCGLRLSEQAAATHERQKCSRCGYIHYINPAPGITIIIHDDDGRVLIGKRSENTEYGGAWCLPGGYIEYEESFIETAHREVMEETGLSIAIEGIINIVSNLLDEVHHTLVVVLIGRAVSAMPRAGDDIEELKWVAKEEHAAMEYAFEADMRIVDRYFEGNIEVLPLDGRYAHTDGERNPW